MKILKVLMSFCIAICFIACDSIASGRLTKDELLEKRDYLELYFNANYTKGDSIFFEREDSRIESFVVYGSYSDCKERDLFDTGISYETFSALHLKNDTMRISADISINMRNQYVSYLVFVEEATEQEPLKSIVELDQKDLVITSILNGAYLKCQKNIGIIEISDGNGHTWKLKEHKKVNNQN